jgi:uncharacterized membrane protein
MTCTVDQRTVHVCMRFQEICHEEKARILFFNIIMCSVCSVLQE